MRTIKVWVKKGEANNLNRNYIGITENGQDSYVWWTDQQLAIEQMKDRIVAAVEDGTFNAQMLEDLADLVREKAYQDGCDDTF